MVRLPCCRSFILVSNVQYRILRTRPFHPSSQETLSYVVKTQPRTRSRVSLGLLPWLDLPKMPPKAVPTIFRILLPKKASRRTDKPSMSATRAAPLELMPLELMPLPPTLPPILPPPVPTPQPTLPLLTLPLPTPPPTPLPPPLLPPPLPPLLPPPLPSPLLLPLPLQRLRLLLMQEQVLTARLVLTAATAEAF